MTVALRAFAPEHIPTITAACSDWRELSSHGPPYWRPRSPAELDRKISATAGPSLSTEYNFVIEVGGRLVGECSLHAIDWRSRVAQVGVCLWDPADRGGGHGRAAIAELIQWADQHLDLARLEAWILGSNQPSLHLFKAAGFTHEGTLFARYVQGGRRHDVEVLGRLATSVIV